MPRDHNVCNNLQNIWPLPPHVNVWLTSFIKLSEMIFRITHYVLVQLITCVKRVLTLVTAVDA